MKEIILTRGKVTLVDDADYDYLSQWKWHASNGRNTFYATRIEDKRAVFMHRQLMDYPDRKLIVDHKDGDGLNNQRSNLRIATNSQNLSNRGGNKGSTSKYKGVFFHRNKNNWMAQIIKDYKVIYLGSFKDEKDAAIAYNEAAVKYHGEFAWLNQIN